MALGRAGADVAVNHLASPLDAEATVAEIRQHGVRSLAHQADVADEDQVRGMFERIVQEFGTVDI